MVRLREIDAGYKACCTDAHRIRSALDRLDVYRRVCILDQVFKVDSTQHIEDHTLALRGHATLRRSCLTIKLRARNIDSLLTSIKTKTYTTYDE